MKQLTVIFTILTALLLATSCSKEELPGDENTDEPGQMQTYTFTVSPDLTMEGDAETRSEGTQEEMPTRCFMQILGNNISQDVQQGKSIENGSFTFSVNLPNTTYTFLFWADNGSGDTPTDLQEVQYTPETVAFAAKVVNTPENVIKSGVSLKHAVMKLSLKTTKATSASEGESIKVTTTCATIYNVDNLSASSPSAHTATKTFDTPTDFAANSNIATFYFIPMDEAQDVDVEFHLLKQTIQNISLAANTHVTLQGDLSEGNPRWGATKEYAEKQIERFFYKDNGDRKGTPDGGDYYFYLPKSDIEKLESVIGAIFHKEVEIRLDNSYNVFDEALGDEFYLYIKYIKSASPESLLIFVNDVLFCIIAYTDDYNSYGYEDFSTVSDVLEQSTD